MSCMLKAWVAPISRMVAPLVNTIIPKVRLETHGWEMVPLDPEIVADYVAIDGGSRPKEIAYPLVQQAKQGAELATYDIVNARELDGIVLPAKVYCLGYRPGDCITLQIPEANLNAREVIVRQREIEAGSMDATLTCRTETAAKHAFALGRTGTPLPTPELGRPPADTSAPDAEDWTLVGLALSSATDAVPAIAIEGAPGALAADAIIFQYRPVTPGAGPEDGWIAAGVDLPTVTRKEVSSVVPGAQYEASVRYRVRGVLTARLLLRPVTAGEISTARAGHQIITATQTVAYPVDSTSSKITVTAFSATIDTEQFLGFPAATFDGLTPASGYVVLWHLPSAAYLLASAFSTGAATAVADGSYVIIRYISTAAADGTYPSSPTPPGGDGGGGYGGGIRDTVEQHERSRQEPPPLGDYPAAPRWRARVAPDQHAQAEHSRRRGRAPLARRDHGWRRAGHRPAG